MAPAQSGKTSPVPRSRPSARRRTRVGSVASDVCLASFIATSSGQDAFEQREEGGDILVVRQARRARHGLRDRRLDELEKRVVSLDSIDEDEPAGVLEL